MPILAFGGFTASSAVAFSATRGGVTDADTVAAWEQANMAEISVLAETQEVAYAPAPVWLTATPSGYDFETTLANGYDPADHEIYYDWHVEKSDGQGGWLADPLGSYDAPQNILSQWNNASRAHGRRVGFCLSDPGTYRITCNAYKFGYAVATDSSEIVVADQDATFPGTSTGYLDPTGIWPDAPAGAVLLSSSAAADSFVGQAGPLRRLLFARDRTHIVNFDIRGSERLSCVAARGPGAKPVISSPFRLENGNIGNCFRWRNGGGNTPNADTQITFDGVTLSQPYDDATETAPSLAGGFFNVIGHENHPRILFHDVHIAGGGLVFTGSEQDVMLADCVIDGKRTYGFYSDRNFTGKIALLGTRINNHPVALEGGPKSTIYYNENACVRIENCPNVYVGACDFFNRTGWSGAPYSNNNPCLRINTGESQGVSYHVDRSVMEGGSHVISNGGGAGSDIWVPGNFVFDKVLVIGTARTNIALVNFECGGATFRNVLGIAPNVPAKDNAGDDKKPPRALFRIEPGDGSAANLGAPIRIHNCTYLSLTDTANEEGASAAVWEGNAGINQFSDFVAENNVAYKPLGNAAYTDDGALDVATVMPGIAPRYGGSRYNYDHEEGTLAAEVPDGGSFSLPYPDTRDTGGLRGSASPTDQTYWTVTRSASDTNHRLNIAGAVWQAMAGEFAVDFDASEVTITNQSGVPWPAGSAWMLRLDRKSMLDTDLPVETQYASPATLPLPRPLPGSKPLTEGDKGGLKARDDLLGVTRPPTGNAKGALLGA